MSDANLPVRLCQVGPASIGLAESGHAVFKPDAHEPDRRMLAHRLVNCYNACVGLKDPNGAILSMLDALEDVLEEWKPKECNCDGAVDAPYACYFHRIERKVRDALRGVDK